MKRTSPGQLRVGRVQWFCGADQGNPSDIVKWAIDALSEGHDTPSLRVLAGLETPPNAFEVKELANRTLAELGIEVAPGDWAHLEYALEVAESILEEPEIMGGLLDELASICQKADNASIPKRFYLLYQAFPEIQDLGLQQYLEPEVNAQNIEAVVLKDCRDFIRENAGRRSHR